MPRKKVSSHRKKSPPANCQRHICLPAPLLEARGMFYFGVLYFGSDRSNLHLLQGKNLWHKILQKFYCRPNFCERRARRKVSREKNNYKCRVLLRTRRQMKKGPPRRAVIIPTGISASVIMVRDSMSQRARKLPPARKVAGIR